MYDVQMNVPFVLYKVSQFEVYVPIVIIRDP